MKKIIVILALVAMSPQLYAQQMHRDKKDVRSADVPAAVMTAFNNDHKNMRDVEWEKDDSGYYTAEIDGPNDKDIYITYDSLGKFIREKQEIADNDLPGAIMVYLKDKYKEDEARHAYKVTDADGKVSFKVKMKGDHLMFDSDGKLIKSEKAPMKNKRAS